MLRTPLPHQEGVPQVVRSTLLQVTRWRQIGSGGGPPVCIPDPPLSHDISGSNSRNKIKYFNNVKKIYPLIVKPNFGCSTKDIYSKVRKFDKAKFGKGAKKMFDINFLKDMKNSLETIAFLKYPRLKNMKLYLENSLNPVFVRMTGSGSALVAYFQTKKRCERAKKKFIQKYKNIWYLYIP